MQNAILWFLLGLAVLLGVARLLGEVFRSFGFPAVVGGFLAGLVLGKTCLGRLVPGAFLTLFPQGPAHYMLTGYTTVAVMLLLVVAGIEIDLSVVRRSGRVVLLTAPCGMLLCASLAFAMGMLLPDWALADPSRRGVHALFLAIAISISALPVIAKTLLDLGLMKTEIGLIILSVSVLDDLVGVMAFSILSRQFKTGVAPSATQVASSIVMTALFVAGTLLIVRPLADRLIAYTTGHDEAATGRTLSVIAVLALLGAAATEALGMQAIFGGFVMGVAVGDSRRLREHTRRVLTDFVTYVFTPAFFATMALQVDFVASFNLGLVVLVTAVACVAKVTGCTLGARLSGVGWRSAAAIGFGLNARGAMEILLALLALEAKIIAPPMFVALVVMALLTSLISGPALLRLLRPQRSPVVALLSQGAMVLDPVVRTREELIDLLARSAAECLDRVQDGAYFAKRALEREALASTGVGDGVAFPHAEVPGLDRPVLAFARLASGIDFDAPDGVPVRLVFLLLMPPRDYERQIQTLSAMARLMTREEIRRALLVARTGALVLSTLDDVGRTPLPWNTRAAGATASPRS